MTRKSPPLTDRIKELIKKYHDDIATDEEIRELFRFYGESEEEIQHRIDVERGDEDPDIIV